MKQFAFKSWISLLVLIALLSATTKKQFEGKIVYSITYEELPEGAEQYVAMLPKENVLYIKKDKTRTEQSMGMGGSQVIIANRKTSEAVVLMDIMGQKLLMRMNKEELKNEKQKPPKINYLNETSEIAGYHCKKAEVFYEGQDDPLIVFYTQDLPSENDDHFEGLKGFPLQYEVHQNGMTMTIKATVVSREPVPDKLFEIPEGYKEVTKDEMKQMFGK